MTETTPIPLVHRCSMPTTPVGGECGEGMDTPIWEVKFSDHDGRATGKLYRCGAHLVPTVLFLATSQSDAEGLVLESVTRISGKLKRGRPS